MSEGATNHQDGPSKNPSNSSNPLDLDRVEAAVNEAAKRANAIWIAFLTLNVYIFVATFTITPLNLLRGVPVHLPIFNADLPVGAFFCIAPFLMLATYFYLVVQLQGLAEKVAAYEGLLSTLKRIKVDREWMRRRLDNSIFTRVFSEGYERWPGSVTRIAYRMVAVASVVLAPIVLVIIAQLVHLPNQNAMVNDTLRLLVVATIVVASWFWFGVLRPRSFLANIAPAALFCASCCFSVFVAVFPGEPLYDHYRPQWVQSRLTAPILESVPDRVALGSRFPFSNRLVILQEIIGASKSTEAAPTTVSLRGRSLRNAIFDGTIFQNTDFTGANLIGASMRGTVFAADTFGCADSHCTDLSGADLENASLKEANLSFITAYGINLKSAMLLGASLYNANLQGASLDYADLEGADLTGTGLQGANLANAKLEAATLWQTALQGAGLNFATLQAASMSGALLQDAVLDSARIEGSDLTGAGLKNASFRCVKPYRTKFDPRELQTAAVQPCPAEISPDWIDTLVNDQSPYTRNDDTSPDLGYTTYSPDTVACAADFAGEKLKTAEQFKEFLDLCTQNFSNTEARRLVRYRFEILSPSANTTEQDAQDQSSWSDLEKRADRSVELSKLLVGRLKEIACIRTGAPFVARGIVRNRLAMLSADDRRPLLAELKVAAQTHSPACPGVHELMPHEFD
jgi:uncharacterized protein YjbI with pentapeptide repeats